MQKHTRAHKNADTCQHPNADIFPNKWIHTHSIVIPSLWAFVCRCAHAAVCVCEGVTFPVSRITTCLIFPLSSSQRRNLTLQGLPLLCTHSILRLECSCPSGCACVCVCKRVCVRKLSGWIKVCPPYSTLGWKTVMCTFPPSDGALVKAGGSVVCTACMFSTVSAATSQVCLNLNVLSHIIQLDLISDCLTSWLQRPIRGLTRIILPNLGCFWEGAAII